MPKVKVEAYRVVCGKRMGKAKALLAGVAKIDEVPPTVLEHLAAATAAIDAAVKALKDHKDG